MAKKKKIVIANWKMNPQTVAEAKKLFLSVKKNASKTRSIKTIICPPFIYLTELKKLYSGSSISIGSQDVFFENKGAHTGEVSPKMLKNLRIQYVTIGHSEKRALGESNEIVNKKVIAASKEKMHIVLCVGEKKRDAHAGHLEFVREQLQSALSGISRQSLKNIIVAYEPIWAIGKSDEDALSPNDMHEMSIFIRKILSEIYGKKSALLVPIIYGGSAEPENVKILMKDGEIDGFLVGHASLKADDFSEILEIVNKI